eukprot:GHVR01165925.1.p1 GENE.GHVR01165925.1~~GHVR01165925.1.p1  ORF type:complete len:214 (-),score=45.76 GHVR01165925.1:389-1030(-)
MELKNLKVPIATTVLLLCFLVYIVTFEFNFMGRGVYIGRGFEIGRVGFLRGLRDASPSRVEAKWFFNWNSSADDSKTVCDELKRAIDPDEIIKPILADLDATDHLTVSKAKGDMTQRMYEGLKAQLIDRCPVDAVMGVDPCNELYWVVSSKSAQSVATAAQLKVDQRVDKTQITEKEKVKLLKDTLRGSIREGIVDLENNFCKEFPDWVFTNT